MQLGLFLGYSDDPVGLLASLSAVDTTLGL